MNNPRFKLKKYGTNYGSFWLPENLTEYLSSDSIIYLFGAGEDISFDCILSGILDCKLHIYDPTPRAIAHVNKVKEVLDSKIEPEFDKKIGGGDPNYWKLILKSECKSNNILFSDIGIHVNNGLVKFYQPNNPDYVSCSVSSLNRSNNYFEVEVKNLKTIMNKNNHSKIDLLKLDIENTECDVIDQILNDNIFPKFICVDLDYARGGGQAGKNRTNDLVKRLGDFGYQLIANDNLDVTFMKVQ